MLSIIFSLYYTLLEIIAFTLLNKTKSLNSTRKMKNSTLKMTYGINKLQHIFGPFLKINYKLHVIFCTGRK